MEKPVILDDKSIRARLDASRWMIQEDDDLCLTALVDATGMRQPCEVWTRVMGYHRPVSEFNKGKKAEHAERVPFRETKIGEELEGMNS